MRGGGNRQLFYTNICDSTKTNHNAMRNAQSEALTPSMSLQISWDRGQQWVLQWTRNSGQHWRWLLNNPAIFSSVIGWENCLCLTVQLNVRGTMFTSRCPVALPHSSLICDGVSQRALTSFHVTSLFSEDVHLYVIFLHFLTISLHDQLQNQHTYVDVGFLLYVLLMLQQISQKEFDRQFRNLTPNNLNLVRLIIGDIFLKWQYILYGPCLRR